MTQWSEALDAHPFHAAIAGFREFLDGYQVPDNRPVAQEAIDRLHQVAEYVDKAVNSADPTYLSPQRLQQLQKAVQQAQNELAAFTSDNNEGHFTNVHNHADTLLDLVSRFPRVATSEDAERLIDAARSYRERSDQLLEETRNQAEQINARVSETESRTTEVQQELGASQAEVAAHNERVQGAIAEFESRFTAAEQERQESFQQAAEGFSTEVTTAVEQVDTTLETLVESWSENSRSALETLEEKKHEAIELVGVIGNVGVTGNFKEVADTERKAANWLRLAAIAFMVLIVGGVVSTIWIAVKPESEWQQIAIRIGVTLALAVPATYAARESSGHRRIERATRRFELELASLDPYLEKLPEEMRHEVKRGLSERFFGSASSSSDADDELVTSQADVLNATLKQAFELAKRAVDKLPTK